MTWPSCIEFHIGNLIIHFKNCELFGSSVPLLFVGPFEITDTIGDVAYRLKLPPELLGVHCVFHVLTLKKYAEDLTRILYHKPLDFQLDASYMERSIAIIDTKD